MTIKEGLEFAVKHDLSVKDMVIILQFLEGDQTHASLKKALKLKSYSRIGELLIRLKLKGIIELKSKTEKGAHVYTLKKGVLR